MVKKVPTIGMSVRLPVPLAERLARRATEEGRPQIQIIREALERYLREPPREEQTP